MKQKKNENRNNLLSPIIIALFISFISVPSFPKDNVCTECHLTEKGKKRIDIKELKMSVHKDTGCTDCHGDLSYPHTEKKHVDCSQCHEEETADYTKSVHGKSAVTGDTPSCTTCHGSHGITKLNRTMIPNLCLNCHSDRTIEEKYNLPGVEFIQAYRNSVHGKAVYNLGLINAPVCSNCHNSHLVLPPDEPLSTIYKKNIPDLCGKCHSSEKQEYLNSIHGTAIQKNIKEAPVCIDCHGEHTISIVTDPNSRVSPKNLPNTCSKCHDNVAFAEKFGFRTNRFTTYLNTFHGVANVYGLTTVANCSSCHGYHSILPSSDPRSPTHPDNIPKTCGKCHPGAGINFAKGPIHVEPTPTGSRPAYYVRTFYKWFIGALCVLFLIHIIVDYAGYRKKKKSFAKEIKIDEDEKP
jgi:predicted CXXCH cytochrome family protein